MRATATRLFVGRRAEARRLWKALSIGRNAVVSGRYGVGRTAFVRHVAETRGRRMRFVLTDFSASSGAVTRVLYGALAERAAARADVPSYRTLRHRVLHDLGEHVGACVVVLDNITQLTRPRLRLVSDLARTGHFRIVAIVGEGLPSGGLNLLRRCLNGPELIQLGWLRPPEVRDLLRGASAAHGFGWTEEEVDARVGAIGGYPLGIMAAIERERRRRPAVGDPAGAT